MSMNGMYTTDVLASLTIMFKPLKAATVRFLIMIIYTNDYTNFFKLKNPYHFTFKNAYVLLMRLL